MIPVCTRTVSPRSSLILAIASTNLSSGTDPSGKHPPLIRQPTQPLFFKSVQVSISAFGVGADSMVSRTFPLQCLQFKVQEFPVTEIVGKVVGDEWKYSVL